MRGELVNWAPHPVEGAVMRAKLQAASFTKTSRYGSLKAAASGQLLVRSDME
jgi:hypothetical protein